MEALVISDQPLTVVGVRSLLRSVEPGAVVHDATHMGEAMRTLAETAGIGLIVLDLDISGPRSLAHAALLRDVWHETPLVVISSKACDTLVARTMDLGVAGYVLKNADTHELREAFRSILAGETVVQDLALAA